ncbi:MAG: TenA family transcriptional regulator [Burkholderiales bacterium]
MKSPAHRAKSVGAHAQTILKRIGILDNPYLVALADGSMSRSVFQITQEQFFYAVTFFPRPMAALVGRIADPHRRLDILHNLVEEHGEFDATAFHHNTFKRFLSSLGSDADALEKTGPGPEVRAFNSVLTTACVLDELEVGVGCMGIIEHAFSGISAAIGNAVVNRKWIERSKLAHYKLHSEIDERHADEFYAVVEPSWSDPGRRYFIIQGLELGAYVFDRLYKDLFARATSS